MDMNQIANIVVTVADADNPGSFKTLNLASFAEYASLLSVRPSAQLLINDATATLQDGSTLNVGPFTKGGQIYPIGWAITCTWISSGVGFSGYTNDRAYFVAIVSAFSFGILASCNITEYYSDGTNQSIII